MQFKVPQDVQREDQILWFITIRQLGILLVGFGISYFLFVKITKAYSLNDLESFIIWIPMVLSIAFAFLKIKNVSFFKFILLAFEHFVFRARRRFWQSEMRTFVSSTTNFSINKKTKKQKIKAKNTSNEKMKNLAKVLDGEKPDLKKEKNEKS
jgi:hypothetical protein